MAKQVCSLARRCYLCACDGRVVCFYYFTFNVSLSQPPKTASKIKIKKKKKSHRNFLRNKKNGASSKAKTEASRAGKGDAPLKKGRWALVRTASAQLIKERPRLRPFSPLHHLHSVFSLPG